MLNLSKTIKMVITDFDGIITDNCVYIDSNKNMTRKLNFKDIMGFSLLKKNGYKIGIISGEANSAIEVRYFPADLMHSIIEKYSLSDEEYLYIGDDVNDFDSLKKTKYAITVPNAIKKVKEIPNIQITQSYGGDGAFREVVDSLIL